MSSNTVSVGLFQWVVDGWPEECPRCNHAVHPTHLASVVVDSDRYGIAKLDVVFQCPREACSRAFIAACRGSYGNAALQYRVNVVALVPKVVVAPTHSAEVLSVSPQGVAIYNQAYAAEQHNLGQVAGCGYRKALEFIVKDYCVGEKPGDEEEIKKAPLAQVIEKYIDNAAIKDAAEMAAWLGNDETHYVRKWEQMDIDDLKAVLQLTENWITTAVQTAAYRKKLPKKTKR